MRRYTTIPKEKLPSGKLIYKNVKYPTIKKTLNDIYVFTTVGDRFDTLAQQYYGNSSYWWIISIANEGLSQDSLTPPVGAQIRIPSNPSPIISDFENMNK